MVHFNIEGVVAPVFLPVHKDGSLNLAIIPSYMQYLIDHGVNGILVGGTTGEYVTLSMAERKSVLETWIKAAENTGTKVIAQVGGVPLPDVLEMAKFAEAIKSDAILTLPEIYYKPKTEEQLVKYLELVSNAAPTLPLLYYHFPMMSGVEVNIPKFFKLASARIPNFKGMKADLGVAVQLDGILGDDQRIFNGNHMLGPAVLLGVESSIATVTNIFPDLVFNLVNSTKRADVLKTREYQRQMNALVDGIASQGDFLPAMKAAMAMVTGIKVGPPRLPMAQLDEENLTNVQQNLTKLGLNLHGTHEGRFVV